MIDENVANQSPEIVFDEEALKKIEKEVTKLLKKYKLSADKIHFDNGNVTLYFGELRVALGNERNRLEDKIMRVPKFLETVSGEKGVLHMENYDETKGKYIYKPTE